VPQPRATEKGSRIQAGFKENKHKKNFKKKNKTKNKKI